MNRSKLDMSCLQAFTPRLGQKLSSHLLGRISSICTASEASQFVLEEFFMGGGGSKALSHANEIS